MSSEFCSGESGLGSLRPAVAIDSLRCRLPAVPRFNSAVRRFNPQIVRGVLEDLRARCVSSQALSGSAAGPGTRPVLLGSTATQENLPLNISLSVPGITINTLGVRLANVRFTIIGFSSAIVQVAGDVVVSSEYTGIDSLPHTQEQVIPFVFIVTVPGTFPPNATAQGGLTIANQTVSMEVNPSTLALIGYSLALSFAVSIQIVAPA
jgi:hypothetical protein